MKCNNLLESVRYDLSLHLIIRRWNSLIRLQPSKSQCTSLGLVWNHPENSQCKMKKMHLWRVTEQEWWSYPRIVLHRILAGERKWIGPCDGLVFILLRKKRKYFIFWRTRPPERQISSARRTTTFWPFKSSFAMIDERRPNIWWRASTTTTLAQIPDPDTISKYFPLSSPLCRSPHCEIRSPPRLDRYLY